MGYPGNRYTGVHLLLDTRHMILNGTQLFRILQQAKYFCTVQSKKLLLFFFVEFLKNEELQNLF